VPAIILLFIFIPTFWLLIVRPQQQRQKKHRELVASLVPGDRVEAFSGIHGTLVEVHEQTVQMEVAPDVVVTMARLAVASRIDVDPEDQVDPTNDAPEEPFG
jgi:preprotein translocase subunit YajC